MHFPSSPTNNNARQSVHYERFITLYNTFLEHPNTLRQPHFPRTMVMPKSLFSSFYLQD